MKTWIASATYQGAAVQIVLSDESDDREDEPLAPGETVCAVHVDQDHYTARRRTLASTRFASLDEARKFCRREYAVEPEAWEQPPEFACSFSFDYNVSDWGVPQPYPVGLPTGDVMINLYDTTICGDDDRERVEPMVDIAGTPDGLRYLAALLLLCADSEQYDESFHVHLEDLPNVRTNLRARFCGPKYLRAVKDATDKGRESNVTNDFRHL